MPTTAWTAFLPEVMPDVPSCSEAMALNAIAKAAREFYRRSRLWTYYHPAMNVVAGQAVYNFVPPANAVVQDIIEDSCYYDGRKIYPRAPLALNQMYQDWLSATGTPKFFTQLTERAVRLVPSPTVNLTNGLKMWVWLKPALSATGIETEHYEEYFEGIAHGAKALLMEVPKKPYTDLTLAAYHKGKFEEALTEAFQRANNGRVQDDEFTMTPGKG